MAVAEMGLSFAVLKYARYARGARIPGSRDTAQFLPRPQAAGTPSLARDGGDRQVGYAEAYLRGLNPKHKQFELLPQEYLARRGAGPRAIEIPVSGANILPARSTMTSR